MMKKFFSLMIAFLLITSSLLSTASIVEAAPKKQNRAIMGVSALTPQQMADYVKKKNPRDVRLAKTSVEDLAKLFVIIGAKEGVRGDVAFAQALKETGYFRYGGDVLPKQHNYSGIGTTCFVFSASFEAYAFRC